MNKYSTFMLNRISSSMFLKLYTLSFMIKKENEEAGAVYGKEILDYIKGFDMGWRPSHGTLYPILNSMMEEDLIAFEYECEGRKYYSITDWGRSYYLGRAKDFKKILINSSKFYKTIAVELEL